jgi:hypothetical protein
MLSLRQILQENIGVSYNDTKNVLASDNHLRRNSKDCYKHVNTFKQASRSSKKTMRQYKSPQ